MHYGDVKVEFLTEHVHDKWEATSYLHSSLESRHELEKVIAQHIAVQKKVDWIQYSGNTTHMGRNIAVSRIHWPTAVWALGGIGAATHWVAQQVYDF